MDSYSGVVRQVASPSAQSLNEDCKMILDSNALVDSGNFVSAQVTGYMDFEDMRAHDYHPQFEVPNGRFQLSEQERMYAQYRRFEFQAGQAPQYEMTHPKPYACTPPLE